MKDETQETSEKPAPETFAILAEMRAEEPDEEPLPAASCGGRTTQQQQEQPRRKESNEKIESDANVSLPRWASPAGDSVSAAEPLAAMRHALEGEQCAPQIAQERPKIEQPGNVAALVCSASERTGNGETGRRDRSLTMHSPIIKPCPNCKTSEHVEIEIGKHLVTKNAIARFVCRKCGLTASAAGNVPNAVAAWNRRASTVKKTEENLQ